MTIVDDAVGNRYFEWIVANYAMFVPVEWVFQLFVLLNFKVECLLIEANWDFSIFHEIYVKFGNGVGWDDHKRG
jgi:hypothetical protein